MLAAEWRGARLDRLVQPGELEGCKRICPDEPAYADVCECRIAEHDRAYQHRNLQNYTDGSAHILYAHADTWINLFAFRSRVDKLGNTSLSPRMGLQGLTISGLVEQEMVPQQAR